MTGSLPRYFVARSDAPEQLAGAQQPMVMQIIDSFLVGGRHLSESDLVVGVDALGNLQVCPMAKARQFDELLQGQLTFYEVSAMCGRRMIAVSCFYLFAMQLLEQPGDSPGVNDPVYLYGKLFGVFPDAPNSLGVEGQLTVTRADILSGIVESEKYGFTYAAGSNYSTLPTRCHHFMVPGDSDSELNRGAGLVVVYPLPTAELAAADSSNELTVKQILFDILQSLKKDVVVNNVRSKLSRIDLPVPSRHSLEMDLEARGYVVKGNTAIRKLPAVGPFDGVLESIFGKLVRDKLELPPEGSMADFIELARLALQSISGWPPERTRAVAGLCRRASVDEIERASKCAEPTPVRVSKTPRPSVDNDTSEKRSPQAVQMHSNVAANQGTPAWMKDFMNAHKTKSGTIVTTTAFQSANVKGSEKRDWMQDFGNTEGKIKHNNTKQEKSEIKPDWMADFK